MGDVIKGIGKVVSAPVRAIGHAAATSGIPGINNIGGVAENVGNAVAGKGSFIGDLGKAAKSGAPLAGLALGGIPGGLLGGALGGGGIAGKIGHVLSQPNILGNAEGKFDLGKVLGVGGSIAGMVGQNRQRKSSEKYNNAAIAQRNALMSKILAPTDYGLPTEQAHETPGY